MRRHNQYGSFPRPDKPYYRGVSWLRTRGTWIATFQRGDLLLHRAFYDYDAAVRQHQVWSTQYLTEGTATYGPTPTGRARSKPPSARPDKPQYRGVNWDKRNCKWVATFGANGKEGPKLRRSFSSYHDAVLQRQAWVEQFRVQGYATY